MNGPRIRVVLTGSMGSLASALSHALIDPQRGPEVVALKEGDTIEIEPGDVVLIPSQPREISLEQLKTLDTHVFDVSALDIARELPAKSHGHHAGTAFYNSLPHYRRRDKRRARTN